MLKKYAVRFIIDGSQVRTYIVDDLGTPDAICTALDLLECDVPNILEARGLAIIAKPWPEGSHLADPSQGVVRDATQPNPAIELAAA